MQIPEELKKKWKDLRHEGDADIIASKIGVTGATVRNAFRLGKCSPQLFSEMGKFYAKRLQKVKQYL